MVGSQRLQVMRESQDGFYIAEQDLQIRGPGEMLGTRQTGLQNLRVASLERDGYLLDQVRAMAQQLWQQHPAVRSEEHTSELQSRPHLVCRLLLEKKNAKKK